MNVTKEELANAIAVKAGIPKTTAGHAIDVIVGTILERTREGDKVVLRGFGTFQKKLWPARTGRNPQTGEAVHVPEKMKLKFSPSADL